ncbi:MAG: hypothetical protein ACI8ZO_000504 [Flavobacteriales bacterium]|jgi:hypothetical protein
MQAITLMTEEKDMVQENELTSTNVSLKEDPKKMNPLLDLDSYTKMSHEQLFETAQTLIKTEPIQHIKKQIDAIKALLFTGLATERKAKQEEFTATGNAEMDFEFIQPLKENFKTFLDDFKKKRDAYYSQLEEQQKQNLSIRLGLIEELKALVDTEETMAVTYNSFKDIQERWRNAGYVAKADSSDVYKTYHHHVENFYDYVKINKDLRDLDFQKNLEQKNEIIAKAEALLSENSINKAFKQLQKLHKVWKEETGPVVREMREETWNRFSEITKLIHDKRHAFLEQQRNKQKENLVAKEALCDLLEAIDTSALKSSKEWKELDEQLDANVSNWKRIGYAPEESNDAVWERFRTAQKNIRSAKNAFYKELKSGFADALAKLQDLVNQSDALKDSTDWKETANELKGLQAKWKTVKGAPRKDADKLWTKFRTACNAFFDAMQAHSDEKDKAFEANAIAKADFLAKIGKEKLSESQSEVLDLLKSWQAAWKGLGIVPKSNRTIEDDFRNFISSCFDKLNLDKTEVEKLKLKAKIEQWKNDDQLDMISKEQDFIRREITDLSAEASQLEANIQMFNTKSGKPNLLVASVQKNIDKQRKDIDFLKEKLIWIKTFSKDPIQD